MTDSPVGAGSSRDDAWYEAHDPATGHVRLAMIALAHPEFAEAISRHPNYAPPLPPPRHPPSSYAPAVVPASAAASRTNTLAILALVFSFLFALLGVIFGHVALGQIRRTGEEGRGLAIAGLIIGYVSLGLGLLTLILYVVVLAPVLLRGY